MNEENMKKFHPELAEYYQKGDCCTWIVELRKQVSEKDKEIERLNNIIKNLDKMFEYYYLGNLKYDQDTVNEIYIKYIKLKELKESGNNE